jgi:hypothetical protein
MAHEIKATFSASVALTIQLADDGVSGLASSVVGVGRQSTIVDNSSTRYQDLLIYVKVTAGTNPTSNRSVFVYLIRSDEIAAGTIHRSDGAGTTDAAITIVNAPVIGVMSDDGVSATGEVFYGEFPVHLPGPAWGVAIVHNTGVDLDTAASAHWVRWIGINPEIQ